MRKLLVLAACAALMIPVQAAAAPDAARIAAADRLLKAQNYDDTIDRTLEAMLTEVKRNFAERINGNLDEPLPADVLDRLNNVLDTHMRATFAKNRANMKRGAALIYADHFTVAELDRLAAIQADPVMLKMQTKMPEIAAQTMKLSEAAWSREEDTLKAEIEEVVAEYLKNRGSSPQS